MKFWRHTSDKYTLIVIHHHTLLEKNLGYIIIYNLRHWALVIIDYVFVKLYMNSNQRPY
jgi:hypothetical protein